jgi:hypothetical protein
MNDYGKYGVNQTELRRPEMIDKGSILMLPEIAMPGARARSYQLRRRGSRINSGAGEGGQEILHRPIRRPRPCHRRRS